MKIIIISDIHANNQALAAILPDLKKADHVICLGDIVGYNMAVNEVIDELRQIKSFTCVRGNHDDFLLRGYPLELSKHVSQWIDYAANVIRPDNKTWLANLPIIWAGFIGDLSFLLVHGSPWSPFTDYLYTDNPLLQKLDSFNYDIICFGQTHRAYVRSDKKPFIINPGSVGQSRDRKGLACALQIDTDLMEFTKIEREFT